MQIKVKFLNFFYIPSKRMQQALLFDIVDSAGTDPKSRTQKLYAEIKAKYLKMRNVKKNGVRFYSE